MFARNDSCLHFWGITDDNFNWKCIAYEKRAMRGPATQPRNLHKSQEQLAKFIGSQIGESNDKRATTTIPTYTIHISQSLFIFGSYIGGFSQHAERSGRRFNFNLAQFVCRFKFNSQGYYTGKKQATWEFTVQSISTNFCLPQQKKKRRKKNNRKRTDQANTSSWRPYIDACVWVSAWFSSQLCREWTWNRPLSLSKEFRLFIQNRHNCCLI